jgi:hypothetical protein
MAAATAHCSEIFEKASMPGKKMARSIARTRKPANHIDQQSDKTAADAGQGQLDVHQFRRGNVKLI